MQPVHPRPRMPPLSDSGHGRANREMGWVMELRRTFGTLAILGLGGIVGGGLVVATSGRGAAEAAAGSQVARASEPPPAEPIRGWKKGRGWGWIWGKDDEVGSLNALTDRSRAAALATATRGEVYDLGLTYSRRSYKYAGHSPGEIITFRSPDGSPPDAGPRRAAARAEQGPRLLAFGRPLHLRQRGDPDRRARHISPPARIFTGTTDSRSRSGAATGARASATPPPSRRSSPAAC